MRAKNGEARDKPISIMKYHRGAKSGIIKAVDYEKYLIKFPEELLVSNCVRQ